MQERNVAILGETKEQRRVATEKAPLGKMKGKGRMLLTGALKRIPVRSWLGSAVLPSAKGIPSASRYWSWHRDELLE